MKLSGLPLSAQAASTASNSLPFLVKAGGAEGSGALDAGLGVFGALGLAAFFLPPCFVSHAACFFSMPSSAACTVAGSVSVKIVISSFLLVHCQCLSFRFLGQVLELGGLEGRHLIVEELLLEENFLGLGSEQLLGQTGASGKRSFGILHG